MERGSNLDMMVLETEPKELWEDAYKKWAELLKKDEAEKSFNNYEKITKRAEYLKNKYPDFNDYQMYHLLIGSGTFSPKPKFDFPEDDSVEKFLRDL